METNIFSGGMLLKGSKKMDSTLIIEQERLCSTCKNYNGLNCRVLGKIKNPDTVTDCGFYKDKKVKLNNIRSYRSLK